MVKGELNLSFYVKKNGSKPFEDWLWGLKDPMQRARIQARLDRVASGNRGDYKFFGDGLYELRLDVGPGFRIYFATVEGLLLILFCGGDKSTQKRDIKKAREFWIDYRERLDGHKK